MLTWYTRLLCMCVVLAGCGDDLLTSSARGVILSVDRREYTAVPMAGYPPQSGFLVVATFRNTRAETVYLGRCMSGDSLPIYSVLDTTGDDAAYSPGSSCGAGAEGIAIHPDETRIDTLVIRGPWVRDGGTGAPLGRLEGRFRLVYHVGDARNRTPIAGLVETSLSGEFKVSLQQ